MKKIKKANILIIMTLIAFTCVIGALIYLGKLEIKKEIQNVTKEEKNDSQEEFEIWTIEGIVEDALYEEIADCKASYPDVNFKVKVFKSEIYEENLLNAARTNSLPDMFFTWGDQGLKELVDMKKVKPLSAQIEGKIKEKLRNKALTSYTFGEEIYGMPVLGWDTVMYCNTELFEECGLKLPDTFDELLKDVEIFENKGITPMAMGGSEAWMPSMYYMELVLNETNVSDVSRAMQHPELLALPAFKKAAENYRKLVMLRPWQTYYGEATVNDAVQYFKEGKAAMLAGGSWMSMTIRRRTDESKQYQIEVIPFPVNQQTGRMKGVAGYSDGFALNIKSKLKNADVTDLYFKLVRDLSDNIVVSKGGGLPVYKDQTLEGTSYELLKKCEALFPSGSYHSAYDQLFCKGQVIKYNSAVKSLVKGHITNQKFIEEISGQDADLDQMDPEYES